MLKMNSVVIESVVPVQVEYAPGKFGVEYHAMCVTSDCVRKVKEDDQEYWDCIVRFEVVVFYNFGIKQWMARLPEAYLNRSAKADLGCIEKAKEWMESEIFRLKTAIALANQKVKLNIATEEDIYNQKLDRTELDRLISYQGKNFDPCAVRDCKNCDGNIAFRVFPNFRVNPEANLGETWLLVAHVGAVVAKMIDPDYKGFNPSKPSCSSCVCSTMLPESNDPGGYDVITGVATIEEGTQTREIKAIGAGANADKSDLRAPDPQGICNKSGDEVFAWGSCPSFYHKRNLVAMKEEKYQSVTCYPDVEVSYEQNRITSGPVVALGVVF